MILYVTNVKNYKKDITQFPELWQVMWVSLMILYRQIGNKIMYKIIWSIRQPVIEQTQFRFSSVLDHYRGLLQSAGHQGLGTHCESDLTLIA